MVECTDFTLVESYGNYKRVCELMAAEGPSKWMLRTTALVSSPVSALAFDYILHFWYDGVVYIIETNHPPRRDIPDEDIQELSEWSKVNGWRLSVDKKLLDDPRNYDFWMNKHQMGYIDSEELAEREKKDLDRFVEAEKAEEEEDAY